MSNLKVNSQCIKCGACLSLGFDFLEEKGDGSVFVKDNTFLEETSIELKSLMEYCPVQAFDFDNSVKIKSKAEQLEQIKEILRNWSGLKKPTAKEFEFKESEYTMNIPYIGGSLYTYSSDKAAQNGAETQFNNAAYSKIDVFILQVISQYRASVVGPYYSYGPDTNSVYYNENMKISELLKEAEKLSDKKLGESFFSFEISPASDDCYKMLKKGELVGDNLVDSVHREFSSGSYSSLSSYRMYYDTDDREVYEGTGLFGKEKYSYKYCYKSLSEATRELEKDLRNALGYRKDEIQNHAVEIAGWLVEVYNKKAKEEIERRISMLDEKNRAVKEEKKQNVKEEKKRDVVYGENQEKHNNVVGKKVIFGNYLDKSYINFLIPEKERMQVEKMYNWVKNEIEKLTCDIDGDTRELMIIAKENEIINLAERYF